MKYLFLFCFALTALAACAPVDHFQLIKTEADNLRKEKDFLLFENDQCKIVYNLWSDRGDIGYIFFNKTDNTININKTECFFIMNGIAYDYYKNRTYSKSSSMGVTSTKGNSKSKISGTETGISYSSSVSETNLLDALNTGALSTTTSGNGYTYTNSTNNSDNMFMFQGINVSKGISVEYIEPSMIKIPPKSAKVISEYSILSSRFIYCDLIKFPSKGISTMKFSKENTPCFFTNIISYSFDSIPSQKMIIKNNFFISEISNMPDKEFYLSDYEYTCGKKSEFKEEFYKYFNPDYFYIKY